MALRVTVEDVETGETGEKVERIVAAGDYLLVTAEPCSCDGTQEHATTHVLMVTGVTPAAAGVGSGEAGAS